MIPRLLLDSFAERGQQSGGAFDLPPQRLAVGRGRFQPPERALRDGGDLVQFLFERVRLRLRFPEQLGLGEDALAHHAGRAAPGLVKFPGLPHRPGLRGEGFRHPPAVFRVDARHRRQVTHGDLRRDPAFAHLLLDRLRQRLHQRQAARHPRGAAVEAPGQFLDRAAQPALHLLQQPALLQRRLRLAHAQRPLQHQRVGFAHFPNHGLDRVAAQLLKRGDALVAVDDQIAAFAFDDDDWGLLAGFSQRGEQPPLARRMPHPEAFQAAVQLMKLQLRHRVRLGFQYRPARVRSFPALREVRRKASSNQVDTL